MEARGRYARMVLDSLPEMLATARLNKKLKIAVTASRSVNPGE